MGSGFVAIIPTFVLLVDSLHYYSRTSLTIVISSKIRTTIRSNVFQLHCLAKKVKIKKLMLRRTHIRNVTTHGYRLHYKHRIIFPVHPSHTNHHIRFCIFGCLF